MRKGKVYYKDEFAGILTEDTNSVSFIYDKISSILFQL